MSVSQSKSGKYALEILSDGESLYNIGGTAEDSGGLRNHPHRFNTKLLVRAKLTIRSQDFCQKESSWATVGDSVLEKRFCHFCLLGDCAMAGLPSQYILRSPIPQRFSSPHEPESNLFQRIWTEWCRHILGRYIHSKDDEVLCSWDTKSEDLIPTSLRVWAWLSSLSILINLEKMSD